MVNSQPQHDRFATEADPQLSDQTSTVQHRRLQLVIDGLDEIDAYRQIDDFFAEEGELIELMEVLGVADDDILEQFLSLGFTPRTAPAIEMVPIAFVAWASGKVTDDECAAAVGAIYDSELAEFPRTWSVVQTWLDVRPKQELWNLWVCYMDCRLQELSTQHQNGLRSRLLNQARRVAKASGGWLGIGSICREEQDVIEGISRVFSGGRSRTKRACDTGLDCFRV